MTPLLSLPIRSRHWAAVPLVLACLATGPSAADPFAGRTTSAASSAVEPGETSAPAASMAIEPGLRAFGGLAGAATGAAIGRDRAGPAGGLAGAYLGARAGAAAVAADGDRNKACTEDTAKIEDCTASGSPSPE